MPGTSACGSATEFAQASRGCAEKRAPPGTGEMRRLWLRLRRAVHQARRGAQSGTDCLVMDSDERAQTCMAHANGGLRRRTGSRRSTCTTRHLDVQQPERQLQPSSAHVCSARCLPPGGCGRCCIWAGHHHYRLRMPDCGLGCRAALQIRDMHLEAVQPSLALKRHGPPAPWLRLCGDDGQACCCAAASASAQRAV